MHVSARASCFPTHHTPTSSTSRLSPSLLLGFAALCVVVSLLSCPGFLFWKHTRLFLRMVKSLLLSWGKLLICACTRKTAFFPTGTWSLLFRPILLHSDPTHGGGAVVAAQYQYHPGTLSGVFFYESVHSASFKRQTRRTLLPRSEGKSSGIIFLPNAFPRRPQASAAPGPRADRSTSTPLWFVLSDVETCLAFMKTTPVMLAHWAVLTPGIHSSRFLLGQRVCEQWRHHYAMQTKCWAHWCHIWWRSYV